MYRKNAVLNGKQKQMKPLKKKFAQKNRENVVVDNKKCLRTI